MFWERAQRVGQAVLGVLVYYAAVAAVAWGGALLLPPLQGLSPETLALGWAPIAVGALGVNWVFAKRGWARWRTLGWRGPRAAARGVGGGLALGVTMAAGAVLLAVSVGGASVRLTDEPVTAYVGASAAIVVLLAVPALGEELVFRGYPLARLARATGKVAASLALATVFALAHLVNPEVSAFGIVNIGLAGLVMSAAFFTPGGLPAAWGVHLGWNAGLIVVADAPVSGIGFDVPLLEFAPGGPNWITGGAFGPEGGLSATVVMVAALVWLARRAARANGEGDAA